MTLSRDCLGQTKDKQNILSQDIRLSGERKYLAHHGRISFKKTGILCLAYFQFYFSCMWYIQKVLRMRKINLQILELHFLNPPLNKNGWFLVMLLICRLYVRMSPARSKAWTVFASSKFGVVGSNPTRGMDVCVRLFCVCAVLCVGCSLETGWSPVQGVLPTVCRIKHLKRRPWSKGLQIHRKKNMYVCQLL
jgi:hypothetical protein